MNPWGITPTVKKYPLGDAQRILEESTAFKTFTHQKRQRTSTEAPEHEHASSNHIIQECEGLLRINSEISDLNTNFDSLELYTKYNDLISDASIKQRIRTIENLSGVLANILEAQIFERSVEKQEKSTALKNFLTVEYNYRKVLIQTLKLIKQNEKQLDKGQTLSVRDERSIKDLLTYFYSKGSQVQDISKEALDQCQDILEKNKKLTNLFAK